MQNAKLESNFISFLEILEKVDVALKYDSNKMIEISLNAHKIESCSVIRFKLSCIMPTILEIIHSYNM